MRTWAITIVLALAAVAATALQQSPFSDFRQERAGVFHKITVADLPASGPARFVVNPPKMIARPEGAALQTLPGYAASLYADGLVNPRLIRTAPNGDLFIAEGEPGRVKVARGCDAAGKVETVSVFAEGLNKPFGIAFYPPTGNPTHVYVANTNSVVRFPYQAGDLKPRGPQEVVVATLPSGGLQGMEHWTRDIAFSRDGRKMYVSVGSASNADEENTESERDRALILELNADGSGKRVYASGIRNPVSLAIDPRSGQLWTSVNERDGLGDNLVPDYVTRVPDGGFYGWPWFYMGGHQDPRHAGQHADLKATVKTPDVLIEPHSASLQMAFYTGTQFPAEHRDSIFVAQHGSWNKAQRTGYKVIRLPLQKGAPTGEYQDFLTGFVTEDGKVWGRPVGVAVAKDGALLVSDDGLNAIWRVSYGR